MMLLHFWINELNRLTLITLTHYNSSEGTLRIFREDVCQNPSPDFNHGRSRTPPVVRLR